MRKITKDFDSVNKDLQRKFEEIREKMLQERNLHKADKNCYAPQKTKTYLIDKVYKKKCAYCERFLPTDYAKITIDHYRPKKIYWWLAYEWSNLVLACSTCNLNKDDAFGLYAPDNENCCIEAEKYYENTIIPFEPALTAAWDRTLCIATHSLLLAEKPLFLHPEIDDFSDYVRFDEKTGLYEIRKDLIKGSYSYARIDYTLRTLKLNDTNWANDRKRILETFFEKLKKVATKVLKLMEGFDDVESDYLYDRINYAVTNAGFYDAFSSFFNDTIIEEREFSFVYKEAKQHFENYIPYYVPEVMNGEKEEYIQDIINTITIAYKFYKLNRE